MSLYSKLHCLQNSALCIFYCGALEQDFEKLHTKESFGECVPVWKTERTVFAARRGWKPGNMGVDVWMVVACLMFWCVKEIFL